MQMQLRRTLTRLARSIIDRPLAEWTTGHITSRRTLLDGYWNDFMNNHVQLVEIPEIQQDAYFQEDVYAEVETLVLDAQARLIDAEAQHPSERADDARSGSSAYALRGPARLPRIELKEFDGTPREWESFRDLFRSLVHNDPGLTDVERLHYLKTSIKGDAAAAIQGFEVTAQNYEPAWEALLSRYDNHRLLVRNHIEALLALKSMKTESATETQRILDELNRHRAPLQSLGRQVNQWDDWFVVLGSRAMDSATRLAWEEDVNSRDTEGTKAHPTFLQLQDFLLRRSMTLKASGMDRASNPTDYRRPTEAPRHHPRNVRSLATTAEVKCPACQGRHYLGKCETFLRMNVSSRRTLIAKEALCLNCLRGQHRAKDCASPFSCRSCEGRHHTLIHEEPMRRPETGAGSKRARLTAAATAATPAEPDEYGWESTHQDESS
ncbi:hypothetical protein TKK_0010017 [Trichogramma kaykai]|uniref:CCHC-type domain-containing protein n=1 Tax=Trichogramma kaykai TaxID=54128 RepID=A0ABD2WYW9_9HYME